MAQDILFAAGDLHSSVTEVFRVGFYMLYLKPNIGTLLSTQLPYHPNFCLCLYLRIPLTFFHVIIFRPQDEITDI